MGADDILIDLKDVTFAHPGGRPILDRLSFRLSRGERVGLLGPNGSGKTTLFHVIMGLLKPSAGRVEIFGTHMKKEKDFVPVRKRMGLVFQDPDDQLFCPTVLEDVAFGPLNQGKSSKEAADIARETLSFLGLDGFADKSAHKLSGGEKRLVSLATALSMRPEALLLDEPSSGLDEKTRQRLLDVLAGLDISLVLISHNMDFTNALTDSIRMMKGGKILTDGVPRAHRHVHVHPFGGQDHSHGHH
jgi:cobalt/nickel transport system ATP-binding protein